MRQKEQNYQTNKSYINMKKFYSLIAAMLLGIGAASAQSTTLWNGRHRESPWGIMVGYVNKDWRTNVGDRVIHENLWGEVNKRMHGGQIGVLYQPCFKFGLGLHTGLAYEYYYSVSKTIKDYGFDDFGEHSLYLPLHAMFRIPLGVETSISVYGGAGFNWAVSGKYSDASHRISGALATVVNTASDGIIEMVPNEYGYYIEEGGRHLRYGGGEWPRHMNVQWEVGAQFRYSWFQVGFTYSFGATNHYFYPGYLTRQDKMNVSFVVLPNLF